MTRPTLFGCPRTGLGISLTKRNKASSAHRFYVINIVASLLGPVKVLRVKSIDALLEEGHHFHGQAGLFRIFRNVLAVDPAGRGQFAVVDLQPIVAVEVAEEAKEQRIREAPGWLL